MARAASTWTPEELERIGGAEELRISSFSADDRLRRPRTIWVVRVGDELYVRSVNGPGSSWYRGAQQRCAGRVEAGGITKDVAFADGRDANDAINAAYRTKYSRYSESTLDRITSPEANSTTIRLVSRD
jgi:hypothetical protein